MQFGAHIFLWTDRWSDRQLDLFERAKALGVDCLEIAVGDGVRLDPKRTRRCATAAALQLILSPGAQWPMECDLSADNPAERKLGLAWHKRNVDLAATAGAVAYTGALYGHPGCVQRRLPPVDELARTAENLHALAEHPRRSGVTIVLEPMSHFRTHLVNTPAQVMKLVALADHPNIKVLLDTYHLVTEIRDYPAAIHCVAEKLWGLHACENDRGVPGGGLIPWPTIFSALKKSRFDGCVILESYNSSLGDFAFRRGMFQDVCPDGDQFVRDGLAFLKRFV